MEKNSGHQLRLIGRRHLEVQGVRHVDRFDEHYIMLETDLGVLALKGEGLHVTQLNLDQGNLAVEGYFTALEYREEKAARGSLGRMGRGMLKRMLR